MGKKLNMIDSLSYIGKTVDVIIDRPVNSLHPDFGFKYLVNYGYVLDTISKAGEELDVYIIGVNEPLKQFSGKCVAVIRRLDDEDKLVVAAEGAALPDEVMISQATDFAEKYF